MKTSRPRVRPIARCAFIILVLTVQLASADPANDETHWQSLAGADLNAVHETIARAHPGAIDSSNPDFRAWMEQGYLEALGLLPRVYDYNTMMDAVRYYVTGFRDGHLLYSDNARKQHTDNGPLPITGWKVDRVNNDYVVTKLWEGFPVRLPPQGAKLLVCDDQDPETIFRERIAPFFDRRPWVMNTTAMSLLLSGPRLRGYELRRCEFSTPDNGSVELGVVYVPEPISEVFAFLQPSRRHATRENAFTFRNGVLWFQAANFNLSSQDSKTLDGMLAKVRRLTNVRAVVFDTRGNGGGDSSVGGRIFVAATGGLDYDLQNLDRLPRVYAQWRISDASLATAAEGVQRAKEVYGAASSQLDSALTFFYALNHARAAGQPWYEEWEGPKDGYRVDRTEVIRRHGKLKRFAGKVILLTDNVCASACLDFADEVRLVPNSLHVGQATSADSLYIDIGSVPLPSGNRLIVPLKVWRNRLRGNNEQLVPDVTLDCDMNEDACVEKATLALLSDPLPGRKK